MTSELSQRTVFVSDVHLGARGIQAERFVQFLRRVDCERLYLIGDIVDWLQMRRQSHWSASHARVLDEVVRLAGSGVRVTYVPGNHDAVARSFDVSDLCGIEFLRDPVHECADGRRLLVIHGDQFDRSSRAATLLADAAVSLCQMADRATNGVRRALGLPYYPLGSRVRSQLQRVVPYIRRFEGTAAEAARSAGCHGVVCGHVHIPAIKDVGGTLYCNTGDWVDSCTAIRESRSGEMALIDWTKLSARRTSHAVAIRKIRRHTVGPSRARAVA
jgi:UDP-2,3-diacylglucosamine pyrophosphatase LpxH